MTRAVKIADASGMTTDAKWRAWGSTVNAGLSECGLVQTADSSQINWATETRATTANGTSSPSSRELWRFNDSLQGTAPIYMRLNYGSGGNASGQSPAIRNFSVGTGTDGAAALTGMTSSLYSANGPASLSTTASNNSTQQMLFTHTEGFFMAYGATNVLATPGALPFFFAVERTRDQTTGEPTAEGMYVWYLSGSTAVTHTGVGQAFNFDAGTIFTAAPTACMPPGDSSNYGGYAFPVYCNIPRPLTCAGLVGYMDGEIANYSQFTAAPIGGVNRNYIALSDSGTSSLFYNVAFAGVTNEGSVRTAFLWED